MQHSFGAKLPLWLFPENVRYGFFIVFSVWNKMKKMKNNLQERNC